MSELDEREELIVVTDDGVKAKKPVSSSSTLTSPSSRCSSSSSSYSCLWITVLSLVLFCLAAAGVLIFVGSSKQQHLQQLSSAAKNEVPPVVTPSTTTATETNSTGSSDTAATTLTTRTPLAVISEADKACAIRSERFIGLRISQSEFLQLTDIADRTWLLAVPSSSASAAESDQSASRLEEWLSQTWCVVVKKEIKLTKKNATTTTTLITVYELRAAPLRDPSLPSRTDEWIGALIESAQNTVVGKQRLSTLTALHQQLQLVMRSSELRGRTMHLGIVVDANAASFNRASTMTQKSSVDTNSSSSPSPPSPSPLSSWRFHVEENRTFISFRNGQQREQQQVGEATGTTTTSPFFSNALGLITSVQTSQMTSREENVAQEYGEAVQRVVDSFVGQEQAQEGKEKQQHQQHQILLEVSEGTIAPQHIPRRAGEPLFEAVAESRIRVGPPVSPRLRPFLGVGVESSSSERSYMQRSPEQQFSNSQLCPADLRIAVHIPLYWHCFDLSRPVDNNGTTSAGTSTTTAYHPATPETNPSNLSCPRLDIFDKVMFQHLATIPHKMDIYLHAHRERLPTLPQRTLKRFAEFPRGQVVIVDHITEEHPFWLSWKPRKLIANQLGLYDLFLYLEDDIAFGANNLRMFCDYHLRVQTFGIGALASFLRIENSTDGVLYPSDRDAMYSHDIVFIGGKERKFYYYLSGVTYSAHWIITGGDLRAAQRDDRWLVSQERTIRKCAEAWKPELSLKQVNGKCGLPLMAREESAYFRAPPIILAGAHTKALFPLGTVRGKSRCITDDALLLHVGLHKNYIHLGDGKTPKKQLLHGICVDNADLVPPPLGKNNNMINGRRNDGRPGTSSIIDHRQYQRAADERARQELLRYQRRHAHNSGLRQIAVLALYGLALFPIFVGVGFLLYRCSRGGGSGSSSKSSSSSRRKMGG